jgi:hypothetical protein
MATARAVRSEIDRRRAGWEDLARASAHLASAALSTPL